MKVWIFATLIFAVYARHEEYTGWKTYYVEPSDLYELKLLNKIVQNLGIEVLGHASVGREGLVLVSPSFQDALFRNLKEVGIKYRLHADDFKTHLDLQEKLFRKNDIKYNKSRIGGKLRYDAYQSYETINKYLDDIAEDYPSIVKVVTLNSFDGLPLKYLKISSTNFEDSSKPIIFLDGGTHGREWLSIPPVTYAINRLVENGTDSDLLDKFDWILLPIVNPDGYKYSRETSAAWRKTRSWNQSPWSRMCPGVDIDRNFDFHWNTTGVSDITCSYVYPGISAFSEVETRTIRDILHENNRIFMYISFSSWGSLIMYPWALDGTLSSHALRLHTIGLTMADNINALKLPNFFDYKVGNAGLIRGSGMSGTSIDYAHKIGVPLTFTIELPGLFGGYFMNPIFMEQICFETWEGIKAGLRKAEPLYLQ